MIVSTALAYNLTSILDTNDRILDISDIDQYHTNPDRHFEIRSARLTGNKLHSITIKDGTPIYPSSPEWDKAKLHLLCTTNLYIPALAHNWVHFHFSDICTAMAHNIFPVGSKVHTFIAPFLLSNLKTNSNGLGGGVMDRDIGESRPFWSDYFVINHTDNDYFTNSVAKRTLKFYDKSPGPIVFGFPPIFTDTSTPYVQTLRQCYDVTNVFVNKCTAFVNDPILAEWKYQVVRRVSDKISHVDVSVADLLTTFIWQVCVVHTLDHQMYAKWMKGLGLASGTRVPFYSNDKPITHDDQIQFANMLDLAMQYNPNGDSISDLYYVNATMNTYLVQYRNGLQNIMDGLSTTVDNRSISINMHEVAPSILM
jgi:hypothetical protein